MKFFFKQMDINLEDYVSIILTDPNQRKPKISGFNVSSISYKLCNADCTLVIFLFIKNKKIQNLKRILFKREK